jgi:hypothetical protein
MTYYHTSLRDRMHVAIAAAQIADDALEAAARAAGFRDRWDFTEKQRVACPALDRAYRHKVEADRLVSAALEAARSS